MVLEKTLESPLDCKEIQPVLEKNHVVPTSWQDEALFHCAIPSGVPRGPSHKGIHRLGESLFLEVGMSTMGSLPLTKRGALGRDWGQEEKGTTEDEMGGWHH